MALLEGIECWYNVSYRQFRPKFRCDQGRTLQNSAASRAKIHGTENTSERYVLDLRPFF
jgi:hypothetical protein